MFDIDNRLFEKKKLCINENSFRFKDNLDSFGLYFVTMLCVRHKLAQINEVYILNLRQI